MAERLDLRGVTCPMNYVRAKLALEGVEPGVEVEVVLDSGAPVENVPRSLADDGHAIVSLKRDDDATWTLLVRRAGA